MSKIRLTIWSEFVHERRDEIPGRIYPDGMHMQIKRGIECDDFDIRVATLDMPEHGLTDEVLESTDVMTWWGHTAHKLVDDEIAAKVVRRVKQGMGFIALHSAHYSKPFRALMGTDCNLCWRPKNEHAHVWNINPSHPIAKGVPYSFKLDEEEMYGEIFNIPTPDELVFITWWAGGEVFRGGCTFRRQYGKIFYFHPGHETAPSYYNENVLQVIKNAVYWAKPDNAPFVFPTGKKDPEEPIGGE